MYKPKKTNQIKLKNYLDKKDERNIKGKRRCTKSK